MSEVVQFGPTDSGPWHAVSGKMLDLAIELKPLPAWWVRITEGGEVKVLAPLRQLRDDPISSRLADVFLCGAPAVEAPRLTDADWLSIREGIERFWFGVAADGKPVSPFATFLE